MRRALPAALAFLALAAPAAAQSRPDTLRMSCTEAQGIVLRNGAALLGTGPLIYERYVATRAFCPGRDYIQSAFAPTRDNPQCHVGFRCSTVRPWLLPGS